jgi:uncharacterized membrane-anchored protein YitT (DUF2179 family)
MKRLRRFVPFLALALSAGLIDIGLALIYVPAAIVAAGFALFGLVTFDPDRVSRITWPR